MKRNYSKPTTALISLGKLMIPVGSEPEEGEGSDKAKRNNVDFPDWDKLDD